MNERTLRVATFNIHHAEGKDGVVDISRTARVIETLGADLVALQELDVRADRSAGVDQPTELARMLGMHIHFARAVVFERGEYGIAVAARDGFEATSIPLPRLGNEEPRVAIRTTWSGIDIVATHLSRSAPARDRQTRYLATLPESRSQRALVLGDMNQPRGDLGPLIDLGLHAAQLRISFLHSLRRRWSVDHILVGPRIRVRAARAIPTDASDHWPVLADITVG